MSTNTAVQQKNNSENRRSTASRGLPMLLVFLTIASSLGLLNAAPASAREARYKYLNGCYVTVTDAFEVTRSTPSGTEKGVRAKMVVNCNVKRTVAFYGLTLKRDYRFLPDVTIARNYDFSQRSPYRFTAKPGKTRYVSVTRWCGDLMRGNNVYGAGSIGVWGGGSYNGGTLESRNNFDLTC